MCALFIYLNPCRFIVGMLSVCCRFIVGLSSGLSVWCRLWFQYFGDYRFWIGVMSVIYRFQIGRFHPDITPTWARLFLLCLLQHCRRPTAARLNDKLCVFVGFVSVWPVWLGHESVNNCRSRYQTETARALAHLKNSLVAIARMWLATVCSRPLAAEGSVLKNVISRDWLR